MRMSVLDIICYNCCDCTLIRRRPDGRSADSEVGRSPGDYGDRSLPSGGNRLGRGSAASERAIRARCQRGAGDLFQVPDRRAEDQFVGSDVGKCGTDGSNHPEMVLARAAQLSRAAQRFSRPAERLATNGNRRSLICQRPLLLSAYACLLSGQPPPPGLQQEIQPLRDAHRSADDLPGSGNLTAILAVMAAAKKTSHTPAA